MTTLLSGREGGEMAGEMITVGAGEAVIILTLHPEVAPGINTEVAENAMEA